MLVGVPAYTQVTFNRIEINNQDYIAHTTMTFNEDYTLVYIRTKDAVLHLYCDRGDLSEYRGVEYITKLCKDADGEDIIFIIQENFDGAGLITQEFNIWYYYD